MKEVLLILLFSTVLFYTSQAQNISLDAGFNGYIFTVRANNYPNFNVIPHGLLSLIYSNKISSRIDYNVGIGSMSGREFYFERDAPIEINQTIREEYYSGYLSLSIGGRYWFKEKRKGFYIHTVLIPHILISSKKVVVINENSQRKEIDTSGKDSFESFNLLLNTGIGYDLYIYRGISVYISFNSSLLVGSYVKDGADGTKFTRALNLGLSYRLY